MFDKRENKALSNGLLVAALAGLLACGGRSVLADPSGSEGACPLGYTCVPVCPAGEICTPTAGPSGSAGTSDAGSTTVPEGGYPEGSTAPSAATVSVLDYRVIDAEFSEALSAIVMVSDSPSNSLHIYDIATGSDRDVPLPLAPVAVAVDPTGLQAAVAFNAHVAWIDLKNGMLKATCDLSSDAFDVALSSKSVAYVLPKTDQWVSLHAVDLTTCSESNASSFGGVYASSHIALHPSENAVFLADEGLSPSRINRCDLTKSPFACADAEGSADWGTYGFCGNLWISADGARIYSGCGVTLRVPGNVTSDSVYSGTLQGVSSIQHLSEFPHAKRVAFVPGSPLSNYGTNADTVIQVHETDYLGFVAQYQLPMFPLAGASVAAAHGRFVFATPTMDTFYVVVQADAASGALKDFAIAKLRP